MAAKENFAVSHFHNSFRLFDVLPNFILTTSGAMGGYYLYIYGIYEFPHELPSNLKLMYYNFIK